MTKPEMMVDLEVRELLGALARLAWKTSGGVHGRDPVGVLRREAIDATTGYNISSRLGCVTLFEFTEESKRFRGEIKGRLFEKFAATRHRWTETDLEEEFWRDGRVAWEAYTLAGQQAEAWIREHRSE